MDTLKLINQIIPTLNFKFPYDAQDYSEHLYYENYHSHSSLSNTRIVDSPTSMEKYAKRVKELGLKNIYSMEHGWQSDFFANYALAESQGLNVIVGSEVYWVKDRHEKDRSNCHMVISALNDEGRKELNYILSIANEDGFYGQPRVDIELVLSLTPENFVITSACIAAWKYEDADEIWLRIAKHFGKHFFFEVQYHNTEKQKKLNRHILNVAESNDIDIICGLDSHYIDASTEDVMRNQIQQYKKSSDSEEDGWYLDYPDTPTIIQRFQEQGVLSDEQIMRSIMNSCIFASEENTPIVIDKSFKIPTLYPELTYEERCDVYKKLLTEGYKKEPIKSKERAEGVRYEASHVMESGVVDYFITNYHIVHDAIENEGGTLTTTSRGSAASFYTNKLLGLTTVDRFDCDIPIYPERFLTKDRVVGAHSLPDIDFNITEQEPFVRASRKLLGEHSCYPLMAIEVLKEKSAWQLYASNVGVEPSVANQIAKYIDEYNKALKHADDEEKEQIRLEDYIPEPYYEIFMQSKDYQSIIMNVKVHACGNILLNGDVRREIGLTSAVSESTGNRTLVAAIQGGYLDMFGYVKNDYLIVSSVGLTKSLFDSIGMKVPTFNELREMVTGDDKTWDVYARGCTIAINQCERASTINKVKKFKPHSMSELSQFIAAIRPGFASLLNTFLNREDYSVGETQVDELLSDTSHFLLYQESIMKILGFLGLEMGETYSVIKSISKKKLKGEKKAHLLEELKEGWMEKFGNLENFDRVWQVISDSAAYGFNAPHAYSMAGDSAYAAWFKGHYTAKFYEVAIQFYQSKEDKDKVNALLKEALQFYGFRLGDYTFGDDNRKVSIDEERKIIIPNLSSVKGFGEGVVETLYELGKNPAPTFLEEIPIILKAKINKTLLHNLTRLNYFSRYGSVPKLLKILEYYETLKGGEAKSFSKEKAKESGIPVELFLKYGKETAKQYSSLQSMDMLKELICAIPESEQTFRDKLTSEVEILGVCKTVVPKANKHHYFVSVIEEKKSIVNIELYEMWSGEIRKVKMWFNSYFNKYEDMARINVGDIIYLDKECLQKKHQQERTNEVDPITGKAVYVEVPDKYEFWLSKVQRMNSN